VESILREFIADAEARLLALEQHDAQGKQIRTAPPYIRGP
jgi:hypothetical protein